MNFDADLKKIEDLFAEDSNALPNLENFKKLGHKLIIVQGKLDTIVPPMPRNTTTLWPRATAGSKVPGVFARIFFVPGMWHGNMTGCSPLFFVRNWVEKGVAPRTIDIRVQYKANLYQQKVDVY